jgi:hypothetical protein
MKGYISKLMQKLGLTWCRKTMTKFDFEELKDTKSRSFHAGSVVFWLGAIVILMQLSHLQFIIVWCTLSQIISVLLNISDIRERKFVGRSQGSTNYPTIVLQMCLQNKMSNFGAFNFDFSKFIKTGNGNTYVKASSSSGIHLDHHWWQQTQQPQ